MMNTDTTPATAGERKSDMDDFMTLRADWKAQGCPSDHPYLRLELPAPGRVEPLVGGITTGMVEAASAMGFRAQSDANIRAMLG